MKIDLHVHTNYSICSNMSPQEAIKAAEEAGLDAIALANHDIKPKQFKGNNKIKVINGVEVTTKEGHLLVLNTKKEFKKETSAQEVINKAENNALIIIPHTYDYFRHGM